MRRRRSQVRPGDHLHVYNGGRCTRCSRFEPQRFTWLEIVVFAFIALFLMWTTVVILYLSNWRGG